MIIIPEEDTRTLRQKIARYFGVFGSCPLDPKSAAECTKQSIEDFQRIGIVDPTLEILTQEQADNILAEVIVFGCQRNPQNWWKNGND